MDTNTEEPEIGNFYYLYCSKKGVCYTCHKFTTITLENRYKCGKIYIQIKIDHETPKKYFKLKTL